MKFTTPLVLIAAFACGATFAAPKAIRTMEQSGTDEAADVDWSVTGVVISGIEDRDVQLKINEELERRAWSPVKSFIHDMTPGNGLVEEGEGLPGGPAGVGARNSVDVDVTPQLINGSVLCFEVGIATYSGGAHGNYSMESVILDAKTGKALTLEQLVDGAAPAEMLEVAKEKLAAEYGADLEAPTSLGTVVLTPEGFDIVWGLYELGPYAMGTPRVSIPYMSMNEQILFDFAVQSKPKPAAAPADPKAGLEDAVEQK